MKLGILNFPRNSCVNPLILPYTLTARYDPFAKLKQTEKLLQPVVPFTKRTPATELTRTKQALKTLQKNPFPVPKPRRRSSLNTAPLQSSPVAMSLPTTFPLCGVAPRFNRKYRSSLSSRTERHVTPSFRYSTEQSQSNENLDFLNFRRLRELLLKDSSPEGPIAISFGDSKFSVNNPF